MTKRPSSRLLEARAAMGDYRADRAQREPDLFSAIESVTANAGEPWREAALRVVEELARARSEFTVEDVAPLVGPTYDMRALGGILLEAKRRQWVDAQGYVSGGAERHGKPVRLWRSRLWRGP